MMDQEAQIRLLPDLLRVALRASAAIRDVYSDGRFETETKDDNSPLTLADRKSHEIIAAGLRQFTPEIPLLSEEGTHFPYGKRQEWHELWLVDPLDGTKEFIARTDDFTVNIALVQGDQPVLGLISAPVTGECWVGLAARRGDGPRAADQGLNRAWKLTLNDEHDIGSEFDIERLAMPIAVRTAPTDPANADVTIMASRSHLNPETEAVITQARARFASVTTTSVGSSLKLCRIAEGLVDFYPRNAPTSEWDTAAGHAIVRAAGGEIWQAGPDVAPETRPLQYNKADLLNPWFFVRAWQDG